MLRMVESSILGWDAALTSDERDAAEMAFTAMSDIRPTPTAKPIGIMTAAEARRALWLVHMASNRKRETALAKAIEEARAEATDPMTFALTDFLAGEASARNWRFEARSGFKAD